MSKTELEIKNISTNHLLEEAQYTVIDAFRTQSGNYEGIQLVESNILFFFLGKNYYLKNGSVFNDENVCLLQNYKRHFEKDGKLYLESMNNALYKLSKNAPVMQTHKQRLYGKRETFYNSLTKGNVPFFGTDKEISYINKKGEVFLMNLNEKYYYSCSADGKKNELFTLETSIDTDQIFFLTAQDGIEFALYKNNEIIHYKITRNVCNEISRYSSPILPIAIEYCLERLLGVFEENEEIFYKFLDEENKIVLSENLSEDIRKKIINLFEKSENQTTYNKIDIVEKGVIIIKNQKIMTYKEQNTTMLLPNYQLFSLFSSNPIIEIEENKVVLYQEYQVEIEKNSYSFSSFETNKVISAYLYGSGQQGGGDIAYIYKDLTTTTNNKTIEKNKILISVIACINIKTNKFETINIQTIKHQQQGFKIKESFINLSSKVATIDYETFVTTEADERDQNRNRRMLVSQNFPVQKKIKEYLEDGLKAEILLKLEQENIGWDYYNGQEQSMHNFIMKTDGLEFMNGGLYISKYNNLKIDYYPKKKVIIPYEGERSLCLKALEDNIESWRMYSPPIFYHEDLKVFCLELGKLAFQIDPVPLPKIKSYSTGGQNTFTVLDSDLSSVQIGDHTKKIDYNFISIDDTIEEIEATAGGTFIGGKTSLRYLRAIPAGNNIELYQETIKFDHVVENVGQEIIFFYGNGFIHYIRENKLVSEIWKIKEAPIKAIKIKNNIVIQTEKNLIWILTINTGEIALLSLSEKKELYLNYSITDKDNNTYFLKTGDPSFAFIWSQQSLRRIRSIESFSHILSGKVGGQQGGVVKIHDKYKLNVRGILKSGIEVKTTFKEKIAKNIIIETY